MQPNDRGAGLALPGAMARQAPLGLIHAIRLDEQDRPTSAKDILPLQRLLQVPVPLHVQNMCLVFVDMLQATLQVLKCFVD